MRLTPLPLAILALCVNLVLAAPSSSVVGSSAIDSATQAIRAHNIGDDLKPFIVNGQVLPRHGDHEDEEEEEDESMEMMNHNDGDSHAHSSQPTTNSTSQTSHPAHAHASGGHHHHVDHDPWLKINETDILLSHSPDEYAYYQYDQTEEGKRALLIIHIILMSLAFFVLYPTALFLKSAGSALAIVPQTGSVLSAILGLFFGFIYNRATPDLYSGSSHSRLGWIIVLIFFGLNAYDVLLFLAKAKRHFFPSLSTRRGHDLAQASNFAIGDDSDGEEYNEERNSQDENDRLVQSPVDEEHIIEDSAEVNWSAVSSPLNGVAMDKQRSGSTVSEDTLFDSAAHHQSSSSLDATNKTPLRKRLNKVAKIGLIVVERLVVVLAYVQLLSGVAVYTGSCRNEYGNGCMAHTIKGSIFFWYGLLSFARYVGAFASFGWAWNKRPKSSENAWSAEFTESFVIWLYGSTNVWLERLGKSGTPWSVKDFQHVSIAAMFGAAGAIGMLLESKKVRAWLSQTSALASGRPLEHVAQPASASFSFNPFPALCIGVTGVAMAAHAQTYAFQVSIHVLWGNLLGAFALFRFLTYFFLYLRPPASILPSRPPTEALASLFLACGGMVFILSTEQVMFAAMRNEWDDMMAFLNGTITFVCLCFAWIIILFALKGWALQRNASTKAAPKYDRSLSNTSSVNARPSTSSETKARSRNVAQFA